MQIYGRGVRRRLAPMLSERSQLELSRPGSDVLINLIERERSETEEGVHKLVLGAYGRRWYRIGGLNYALQRQKV